MIVVSAFFFLTAAGDPQKLNLAKQALIGAVIGLIIALLSGGLGDMIAGWV